jgi:serine/threonine protein kinase
MNPKRKQQLVEEVNTLQQIKSNNVVRYIEHFINRTESSLSIVMEYCEGGSLSSFINEMKLENKRLS